VKKKINPTGEQRKWKRKKEKGRRKREKSKSEEREGARRSQKEPECA
jgi:hypothetical protein